MESLTVAVFNCVNVVAMASVGSMTNVQTFVVLPVNPVFTPGINPRDSLSGLGSLTSNHLGGVNRSKQLAWLVKNWNRSSQR